MFTDRHLGDIFYAVNNSDESNMAHPYEKVAEILRRNADYIEHLEKQASAYRDIVGKVEQDQVHKKAEDVASKLQNIAGVGIDAGLVRKVAGSKDPDVQSFLAKLSSISEAEELGASVGTSGDQSKTASSQDDADARFARFCLK